MASLARQNADPVRMVATRRDAPADAELVGRARSGERFAKELLFRRHVDTIGAIAIRLLADRADAEDVVQDTFVTAFEGLGALREPAAFRGWLVRIAVRKVYRRFRRRRLLRALGLDRSADPVGFAESAAPDASPEIRAELALLDRRVAKLGANERIAWTLRCVEGASMKEVADACGCSVSTAKRRVKAAQRRLGLEGEP